MFKTARPGDICVVNADNLLAMAITVPAGVRMTLVCERRAESEERRAESEERRFGEQRA
jgi:hypothetical protein